MVPNELLIAFQMKNEVIDIPVPLFALQTLMGANAHATDAASIIPIKLHLMTEEDESFCRGREFHVHVTVYTYQ